MSYGSETDPWIELGDGRKFYLLRPRPEDVNIETIAHALSQLCRWTGHTNQFYSVAQHCITVSFIVPEQFALDGLLHDASEAYIGDLSYPLKRALDIRAPGALEEIEAGIHAAITERYGVEYPYDPIIKKADLISLATEHRDVMRGSVYWDDRHFPQPLEDAMVPLLPLEAERAYLERFEEVTSASRSRA